MTQQEVTRESFFVRYKKPATKNIICLEVQRISMMII